MFRKPAIVYGEIVLPAFIYYFGKNSKIVAALLVRYIEKKYLYLFILNFEDYTRPPTTLGC